jgi:large conductance mechanosensitive channel
MAKKVVDKEKLDKIKGKGKGFIGEFKEFIMRGNVMDMAVGVIIGTAFAGLITALTDDFINPLINGIGGAEIAGRIKIYGGQYLNWGHFLTAVINFLIMAFVLFMLLKFFNTLTKKRKKEEEKVEPKKPEHIELLEEIRDLLKKQK